MKLLLDTHALIWAVADDPRLSSAARTAISARSNQIFVSAVSAMEISTKHRLGKLPEGAALMSDFMALLHAADYVPLPIMVQHAAFAGALPIPHKDPFDRMLIAQAQLEGYALVSNETLFDSFGVKRIW